MARNQKKGADDGIQVICRNKRAFHEYEISDRLECGVVLTGTEVKSLRDGHASLEDAYAKIESDEVWMLGSDIPEYAMGNRMNHKPKRPRKLLLHRNEIHKFAAKAEQKGLHAGAAAAVLQGRPGQGGTGGGGRQEDVRQARGGQEGVGPARHPTGDAGPPALTYSHGLGMQSCDPKEAHSRALLRVAARLAHWTRSGRTVVHLTALVESPDHVCCRYRLAAFRPFLERAGHTLELVALPRRPVGPRSGSTAGCAAPTWCCNGSCCRRGNSPCCAGPARLAAVRLRRRRLSTAIPTPPGASDHAGRMRRFAATVRAADAVIAGNAFLAAHAARWAGPGRVYVVPTCVDPGSLIRRTVPRSQRRGRPAGLGRLVQHAARPGSRAADAGGTRPPRAGRRA